MSFKIPSPPPPTWELIKPYRGETKFYRQFTGDYFVSYTAEYKPEELKKYYGIGAKLII